MVVLPARLLPAGNVERARSAGRRRLDPTGDVPDEAGELAGDRGRHLGQRLAGGAHPAEALAEPDLGLPADGADLRRQALAAIQEAALLPGLVPVAPSGLDQDRARLGVAGPGDPAAAGTVAAGMLARDQPEPGHELLGVGEAPQVADLGDEHRRGHQPQAAQGLQGPHEGCQPPAADGLGECRLEPSAARLALPDALPQLLDHELLVRALEGLLAEPEVEAVYVATPNHLHRGAVEALSRAGKAVLCEKPMAAALSDAEAMVASVKRGGIFYGTAFDQRHHPGHRAMRDAIRAGRIGTVTAVRIVYACWLGRGWASFQGQDNWRIDPAQAGGGALIDLAPHGIDLVAFLLDDAIVDIAAMTQARAQDYAVDDGALLIGRTGSGVLANLHVAYNCPDVLPRRRLEVIGTEGQLSAVDTMGQTAGGRVTFTDGTSGVSEDIAFDVEASPFLAQVRAFGSALRRPDERAAWSAERDLHTMRLLARAYGGAGRTSVAAPAA